MPSNPVEPMGPAEIPLALTLQLNSCRRGVARALSVTFSAAQNRSARTEVRGLGMYTHINIERERQHQTSRQAGLLSRDTHCTVCLTRRVVG